MLVLYIVGVTFALCGATVWISRYTSAKSRTRYYY